MSWVKCWGPLGVPDWPQGMQVPTAGPAEQSRCPEAKAMELQQVEKTTQLQTGLSGAYSVPVLLPSGFV